MKALFSRDFAGPYWFLGCKGLQLSRSGTAIEAFMTIWRAPVSRRRPGRWKLCLAKTCHLSIFRESLLVPRLQGTAALQVRNRTLLFSSLRNSNCLRLVHLIDQRTKPPKIAPMRSCNQSRQPEQFGFILFLLKGAAGPNGRRLKKI